MVDHQPSLVGNAREDLKQLKAIFRFAALALLLAGALCASVARGTVRAGDATYVYELNAYASAMASLENDFLASIERASGPERFNLYLNYNVLMGTWLQIGLLEELLDESIDAITSRDEDKLRAALRDQAQFTEAELIRAVKDLAQHERSIAPYDQLRLTDALRSLLSNARATVDRLIVDQCAPGKCAGP